MAQTYWVCSVILPREGDVLERTGYYGAHAWNAGGGARGGNPLHGLRAGKDQRVRGLWSVASGPS